MNKQHTPWAWVPSLYFIQGFAYVALVLLTEVHFQQVGLDNKNITLLSSLLGIPWVIKPIFAPLIERGLSYRNWTICLQLLIGVFFFYTVYISQYSHIWLYVGLFCISIIASAQDFASDGVYITSLNTEKQTHFIGYRSAAYQLGRLVCLGPLVILLGHLQKHMSIHQSWMITLSLIGIIFVVIGLYHARSLPESIQPKERFKWAALKNALQFYFGSTNNWVMLGFIFFMLNGQMLITKILPLYILDDSDKALQLPPSFLGHWFGIAGTIAMVVGGILASWILKWLSLNKSILIFFTMSAVVSLGFTKSAINIPFFISVIIANQLLFGILATLQMAFILEWTRNKNFPATAYAISTSIMVLGFLFPGFYAGLLQESIGYVHFFIWASAWTLLLPICLILLRPLQRLS